MGPRAAPREGAAAVGSEARGPAQLRPGAVGRREALRAAAGGVGAVALGGLLAGCRQEARAKPAPQINRPVIDITFMPWWVAWDQTGRSLLAQQCAAFTASRPGIRVRAIPGPNGGGVDGTAVVTSILSGGGPAVICDYQDRWPQYMQGQAFVALDPYIRRDGLDASVWSASHLQALQQGGQQFALPTYDGPVVLAYRKDLLAAAGLASPDPDWTYLDAAQIWRLCSRAAAGGAPARYGATLWWWQQEWRYSNWLLTAFGGAEMDAAGTRALFEDPASVQAGQWLMPLIWENVVGYFGPGLDSGQAVFASSGGWSVASDVATYAQKFPWDYAPMPLFPQGRATFGNADYWGLNALQPEVEAGWELCKWLAYEPDWQRFCMKTALLPPCTAALWEEWEQTMVQVAPVLKGKQLGWFRDAAQGGYGYAPQFFRYQAAHSDHLITAQVVALNERQTDVPTAFAAVSAQVDALQAAGAAVDAAVAEVVARVHDLAGQTADQVLPPPAVGGAGVAATPAADLLAAQGGGVWALTGSGGDVAAQSDNGTLAAVVSNDSVAEFVCRVRGIVDLDCPSVAPWAKVGLMARGDLSDDAAAAFVAVTGSQGLQTIFRFAAGYDPTGQAGGPAASGAFDPAALSVAGAGPGVAALRQPVWLRLQRQGAVWTASASLDGSTWTLLGHPTLTLMAGVWVGLFVSAVDAAFPGGASGGRIQATFDHVSFAPQAVYRIGTP